MIAKIVPERPERPERSGLTPAQTRDVYYDYDLRGLQTKARFDSLTGDGVTTDYDGFGRVTSSTLLMAGVSRSIGHLYDSEGNRIRITHPDTSFFTYDYDGAGLFKLVRENGGDPLVAFTYDNAGRRSDLTSGGMASRYLYDGVGRLKKLDHNLALASGDQVIELAYNPAGQIVTRSGSNNAYAWNGARAVDRPYSVNGQNQYLAAGSATFGYDANGNLTSDGSSTFVYDVENRLVSASGAKSATLTYDPLGRLWEVSSPSTGATRFLHDDDALIAEYDSAGYMHSRYIHGTGKGADDPLIWYDNASSGWRRALVADQQGSIVAVADMHGNPLAINAYDEYGIAKDSPNGTPGAGNRGRFQYTGQAWLAELGMYYYKARIYSPTLGRFMQTDPIGYEDQINLYAYVRNNPVNRRDPTGNAEVNLGSYEAAEIPTLEALDFPNAFTISGHMRPGQGMVDYRGYPNIKLPASAYSPRQLLELAAANGYKRGDLTFLATCYAGSTKIGTSRYAFAQEYANLSGGAVIASPELVDFKPRGRHMLVQPHNDGGLFKYHPNGNSPTYIGSHMQVDMKTGMATVFNAPKTGSRIRQVENVCMDQAKCGKGK